MRPVTNKLIEAGVEVTEREDGMRVRRTGTLVATDIKTAPHPGFPTDMQQPFAALLAVAKGTSVITETVYESRFRYVNELSRMGAQIRVEGRTAIIEGIDRFTGAPVTATDLRAGATLVCAAMGADGESEISGLEHIDRGYENLVGKFQELGACIQRSTDDTPRG